jgi:hypothetical protein
MITLDTMTTLVLTPPHRCHRRSTHWLRSEGSNVLLHRPDRALIEESNGHGRAEMMSFAVSRVEVGHVRFADRRFAGLSNVKSASSNKVVRADNGSLLCR